MISFIIPTLNEEKLLPELLKQLCDESLREKYDYEIIISDGGSKDNTIAIAKKNVDKVIEKDGNQNQHIGVGRNVGAVVADGDILAFINGDVLFSDIYTFFSVVTNKFTNSNALAMTCSVKVFRDEVKLIDKLFYTFYNNFFHFLNIIGLGMGRGECQIIRKDIFEKVGGYNKDLAAGEDFDLYKRIRRLGSILFSREIIIFESPRRYRKHGHFRILFTWLINSISVMFRKKSHSKKWEQVR